METRGRLDRRAKDGSVARAHVQAAADRGSPTARATLAAAADVPDALEYLVAGYDALASLREYDGLTGRPKSFSAPFLESGMRLLDLSFTPDEIKALVAMDATYLAAMLSDGTAG